jgi:hypothetical protein
MRAACVRRRRHGVVAACARCGAQEEGGGCSGARLQRRPKRRRQRRGWCALSLLPPRTPLPITATQTRSRPARHPGPPFASVARDLRRLGGPSRAPQSGRGRRGERKGGGLQPKIWPRCSSSSRGPPPPAAASTRGPRQRGRVDLDEQQYVVASQRSGDPQGGACGRARARETNSRPTLGPRAPAPLSLCSPLDVSHHIKDTPCPRLFEKKVGKGEKGKKGWRRAPGERGGGGEQRGAEGRRRGESERRGDGLFPPPLLALPQIARARRTRVICQLHSSCRPYSKRQRSIETETER